MNSTWIVSSILVLLVMLSANVTLAEKGVGVNLGQIKVEERLRPGSSYGLPSLGVFNPGNEPGAYELEITYDEKQTQRKPAATWFSFSPQRFDLTPGQTELISIRLTLPAGADPGDYFAYIEAHPVASSSTANVSIAAATRLSFSVDESSWLDARRRQVRRWLDDNQLWLGLASTVLLGSIGLYSASRKLRFRLPFELK